MVLDRQGWYAYARKQMGPCIMHSTYKCLHLPSLQVRYSETHTIAMLFFFRSIQKKQNISSQEPSNTANCETKSPSFFHAYYEQIISRAAKKSSYAVSSVNHIYSSYFPAPGCVAGVFFSSLSLRYSYTVKVTAWPGATRMIRGVMPL